MLKKNLSNFLNAVTAVRKQVSSRQLMVTTVSAALMLAALFAFWNYFILPEHFSLHNLNPIRAEKSKKPSEDVAVNASEEKDLETDEQPQADGKDSLTSVYADLPQQPDLSAGQTPLEGELVKNFGFSFSPTFNDYRFHHGVDLSASEGTAVKCFLDGVIESITTSQQEGSTITVNHGGNWQTRYSHLDEVSVQKDLTVNTGTVLGFLGSPGAAESAEGCHLHFEILHNSEKVNPFDFLDFKQ